MATETKVIAPIISGVQFRSNIRIYPDRDPNGHLEIQGGTQLTVDTIIDGGDDDADDDKPA